MQEDVLTCIHNKLPELSKGQKKIAAYILETCEKAAFLTAGALGRMAKVSESTVVRFATELGYAGYPQMQKALQEHVLHSLTSVQRMQVGAERMQEQDVLTTVLEEDRERIRATGELLDRAAFSGAVEALLSARRIYILGARSSGALASFAAHYFYYMFEDVRLVQSEILERVVNLGAGDVVLAISFPRYSAVTVQALDYARSSGAATIVLTDAETSPLAQDADYLLTARSDMVSLVDSLVAPMSVLNALIVSVASRRRSEITKTFQKLETIWDIHHVYEKNDE